MPQSAGGRPKPADPLVNRPAPYDISGSWLDNPPAADVATPSSDPAVAKTTVTIPNGAGLHTITAQAESPAGNLSDVTPR